jgi:hypothetical protein
MSYSDEFSAGTTDSGSLKRDARRFMRSLCATYCASIH